MSTTPPDPAHSAPAMSFRGSAQRVWKITAPSSEPWRQYRQMMTGMTLAPLAWLVVLLHHVVLGPPLLLVRGARRLVRGRQAG